MTVSFSRRLGSRELIYLKAGGDLQFIAAWDPKV
jgi:hypothetical protein